MKVDSVFVSLLCLPNFFFSLNCFYINLIIIIMNPEGQDSSLYFTILIVLEIVVLILSFIFQSSLTMFNIIRILSLLGAKCMTSVIWVIQYIIFALISALYSFDPVGLWITGRKYPIIQMVRPGQELQMDSIWLFSFFFVLELMSVFFTIKHLEKRQFKISLAQSTQIQMMEEITQVMVFLDLEVLSITLSNLNQIKGRDFTNSQVKVIL